MPPSTSIPDPATPGLTLLPPPGSDLAAPNAPAPAPVAPPASPALALRLAETASLPPGASASPQPAPEAPPSPEMAFHPRRRRGKVARLPQTVRDQINQMLLDGLPYAEIITKLGDHGQDLAVRHIQDWAGGGFQDFLEQERRLEQSRLWYELALSLAQQQHSTAGYQATPKIAVAQICEALVDCGPVTLRQALQQNPLNYIRLLNTLSRLIAGGLKCEQLLAEQAKQTQDAPATEKKGLSPEALKELQTKLRLM